jgi:Flp pilus assembly protein TadB
MIPCFGIVHPVLEQMHWHDLRNETWLAHACFAVYHALVLWKLMTPLGLALVLGVLLATSVLWYRLARRFQGAFVPCCTHIAADLGIIVAAWWSIHRASTGG